MNKFESANRKTKCKLHLPKVRMYMIFSTCSSSWFLCFFIKETKQQATKILKSVVEWLVKKCAGFYSLDRKSTRLNSSHVRISYAVFCLKKKKHINIITYRNTR